MASSAQTISRADTTRYLLHDEATLAQIAHDAAGVAARMSPGRATIVVREDSGITAKVKDGDVIAAQRSGDQALSVTIVDRGRTGRASTGVFTQAAIEAAVRHAAFIAAQVEPDPDSEPADDAMLAYDGPDVPLYAPSGQSVGDLTTAASEIEVATAREIAGHADVVRAMEAGTASGETRWAQAIDSGFCRSGSASTQTRWTQVIAERDSRMAAGHWISNDRRLENLLDAETIGATAVRNATRKLGGRSLSSRDCPVLFDAPIAASLVGEIMQALAGMAQYHKATFLEGALGRQPLADHLSLIEDPFEPFGLASGSFDGEGIAGSRRTVIRAGTVEGYFLSTRSSRKLGLTSTGNANGAWNLRLESSRTTADDDLPAMFRHLDRGLWVTELLGGEVHPVTGAYSKAAAGFWVEGGVAVHPVEDITISGSMPAMLASIEHIGTDVHRSGGIRTGSVLVAQMRMTGR